MLVGSIIGYFTNWLAIRMLFRPHEEKRILGIKLPFTPGMIPKERGRMAKSVGDTVEDYLLTPEKISEIILSQDSRDYLQTSLEVKLEDLSQEDLKVSELIDKLGLDSKKLERDLSRLSINAITSYLREENKRLEIISGLERLYDGLEIGLSELLEKNKDFVNKKLEEYLVEHMDEYMKSIDESMSLGDFLEDDLVSELNYLLKENRAKLSQKTRQVLLSDFVQLALLESVRELVEENVSRLITTFVGIEHIVAKIVEAINGYISSEDYEDFLVEAIDLAKEGVLDLKLEKILASELSLLDPNKLIDRFLYRLDLVDHLQASFSSLSKDYKSSIIASSYRKLINLEKDPKLLEVLSKIISSIVVFIGDVNINIYLEDLGKNDMGKLSDKLMGLLEGLNPKSLINLIDRLKIGKIVEEEINSFKIDFAEQLILDIAERELRAITNLGALLGAILGLLSPLIQYL